MMKINSTQTDWIVFRNITSGNHIAFDYNISAEPSKQWWVLYRGVMPDWANLNENKEDWGWISAQSETAREGTVQVDYEFTPGAIYTLALFKDQTENAYELADYFEFCVPPQDHKLSDRKISGNHITFSYIVDRSSQDSGIISEEQKSQWWVLYRGVMPHWANLNKYKEKWDKAVVAPSRSDSTLNGAGFDYDFTPGAIYTLALFKDQTENAYELADYMEFCVQPQDDNLSNLKVSEKSIAFDYNISAEPKYQWWVLYRGVMPDWAKLNEHKQDWGWIFDKSETARKGTIQFDYECTPGVIYTLALFKDQTENAYDLAYYVKFLGGEQDDSADDSGWIKLQGDNSYSYCVCSSDADNKQKHDSNMLMNVKEGAPYLYAVLTKDDDSIDFPTGVVMTIEGPDGTKYDRDIQEENQLVIMSGSSVRCLIVKDPMPGDWKMTMSVPEGVGFHCECNTVPSKDPYETITTALSKRNQRQKRDLDNNVTTTGWLGAAATGAIIGAEIGSAAGPVGALVGGVVGEVVGNVTYLTQAVFFSSPTLTVQTAATTLSQAAQAHAAPPGDVRIATWNVYHGNREDAALRTVEERVNELVTFGVQNNIGLITFQEMQRGEILQDDNHPIFINIRNSGYNYVRVNYEYPTQQNDITLPHPPRPDRTTGDGYLILYNPRVLALENPPAQESPVPPGGSQRRPNQRNRNFNNINTVAATDNNNIQAQYFQPWNFLSESWQRLEVEYASQYRPPVQLRFRIIATQTVFDFLTWHPEPELLFSRRTVNTAFTLLTQQSENWILAGDLNVRNNDLPAAATFPQHHLPDNNDNSLDHIITSGTAINPEQLQQGQGQITVDNQQRIRFRSENHDVLFGVVRFS